MLYYILCQCVTSCIMYYVKMMGSIVTLYYASCQDNVQIVKGVPKKTSLNFRRSFCLIFLATNMLEGWDIIPLKSEIRSSV